MSGKIEISESGPDDEPAIEALYPAAFPEEDLLPVVRALLRETSGVLSLLALERPSVAGHAVFTVCGLAGQTESVALLGPLVVRPALQRRGIGGALVRAGLERMKAARIQKVLVLGDPAYYGRFGFAPEPGITPPYQIPEDWRPAWQSLDLGTAAISLSGTLMVPAPWRVPAYWGA
jgi:putative acetyltransferase